MLISRVEAAALLEVKVPSIDRALRTGRIFYADAQKLLFDRASLLACWAENRQRRRKPVPASVAAPPTGQVSEAELRRRLLAAQVHNAERQARSEDSERIAVAAIERAAAHYVGEITAAVRGAGSRMESEIRTAIPADVLAGAGLRKIIVSWEEGTIFGVLQTLGFVLSKEHAALGASVARIAGEPGFWEKESV